MKRNYDGTALTTRNIRELLPRFLTQVGEKFQERPDLIIQAWPHIIGTQFASMTKASLFKEGILWVYVNNSTLYSVLSQHEKKRLLASLRSRFPAVEIKNIVFRLGSTEKKDL